MRRALPLEVVVFVVGAASLGSEIAAARLLAPYFGASTIVWANTIAIVLLALSAGYWLGGRLADRAPHRAGLSRVVLLAGAGLALVPFVATPFLSASVQAFDALSVGGFLGSLVGVLVLVALPVLLLGAVSPYALRLKVARIEDSGRVSGRLYAISTAGSLAGTFLAALLLIPLLGTRRTFLVLALALVVVGVLGLSRRFALAPLAVAALLALPVGTVKAADGARTIAEADTEYQYARVVQEPDGTRRLELNEGLAVHSLWRPGTVLTGGYWDDPLVLGHLTRPAPPRRVAILGAAGGTMARAFGRLYPRTRVDAVEIDPVLLDLGRRHFDLGGPRLHAYAEDARPFLRRMTGARYDLVVVDAYRQPYIPFYLTTREFFALVRDRLTPRGVLAINVGHPEGSDRLERVLTATLRAVFPHVARDVVDRTNTLVVASRVPLRPDGVRRAAVPAPLRPVAARVAARTGPALRGGEVLTDDHAPVEWLIDGSLVDAATGG